MDAPEESIPAFQKAGTIIPRKDRFRRSSSQMDNDPYTLVPYNSSIVTVFLIICSEFNEQSNSETDEAKKMVGNGL